MRSCLGFLSYNYITIICDRNIITKEGELYQRSNLLISDFRVCDCITLESLPVKCHQERHHPDEVQVHNKIVHNLNCNVDYQLENRILKLTYMCLNQHNKVCRSLLLSKFNC